MNQASAWVCEVRTGDGEQAAKGKVAGTYLLEDVMKQSIVGVVIHLEESGEGGKKSVDDRDPGDRGSRALPEQPRDAL